ncbi:MAG: Mrp family chromosome partitioning ATPase [Psychromonas sp.]|jgi:protein-tyrosine kinase
MNIPYQHLEIEQIYTQVFTAPKIAIAICSANAGEGVTSLTMALAERNLLAGHSTLVVDLNLYRPALKNMLSIAKVGLKSASILSAPQLVTAQQHQLAFTGIVAPLQREKIIKLRQPGVLEQSIKQWLKDYDCVIIDTSPLNRINAQNIPAERVAAACDGAVLMVLAGQTSEAMLCSAVAKLKTSNAQLLGCVFNDRDNPSLKNELLHKVQRISKFSWLTRPLKKMIAHNQLLNLEV